MERKETLRPYLCLLMAVYMMVMLGCASRVEAGAASSLGSNVGSWGGHRHPHAKRWMASGRRERLIPMFWGIRGDGKNWEPSNTRGGAAGDRTAGEIPSSTVAGEKKESENDVSSTSEAPTGEEAGANEQGDEGKIIEQEIIKKPSSVEEATGEIEGGDSVAQDLPASSAAGGGAGAAAAVATEEPQPSPLPQQPEEKVTAKQQGPPEPAPIVLSDQDREVLELLSKTETWDRTLITIARVPAIKGCPEFHLKITKAGPADAFLSAYALGRLARQVGTEAEAKEIRADRRFGQLLECIWCHATKLSPTDVSNVLLGLAVLRAPEDQLLLTVTKTTTDSLQQGLWKTLPPSEIVTLAWSLAHSVALGGFPSPGPLLEALEARLVSSWSALTPHEVARLAWALTVFDRPPSSNRHHDALLRLIGDKVLQSPTEFGIKDLTTVAGALSSHGYNNETVRQGLASAAVGHLAELSVEDLGSMGRALAVWGPSNDVLMLELLVCAEAKRADLRAGQIADILWAFGSTNFKNSTAFLSRELPELFKSLGDFSPPDLVKVLWSYATLLPPSKIEEVGRVGQQQQHLLSALAGRAASILLDAIFIQKAGGGGATGADYIEPVLLVQLAWALATLGHYEEDLFTSIAQGLEKRLNDLALDQLAALAWAFAKVRHLRNSLYDQLALLIEMRHGNFQARDLTLCLWSLTRKGYRLRFQPPELSIKPEQLRGLTPSDAAKLLWALAKQGNVASPELIEAVCSDVRIKLATFAPDDVTSVAWALARLRKLRGGDAGVDSTSDQHKLVLHVAKAALRWAPTFTSAQLATVVQALVTLEYPSEGLIERLSEEVEKRLKALLELPRGREDDLFHLSRCQQLFTFWREMGKVKTGSGDGGEEKKYKWKYDKMKKVIGEAMIHIV